MSKFEGKVVLITGGTGFLGRHLVRRILKEKPKAIRIFSRDEVKHYKVQQYFGDDPRLRFLLGDVRDYERLRRATRGCDIVIHAAALKRIDMIEYNVSESIKTNILGTLNLVDACIENDVQRVVFISSDKACEPVNSYGACKFVSERIIVESNYSKGGRHPRFICVRYGNVLSSTGSVIPFFVNKIKNNNKIPLTHKDMTRFIITSDQAVDLVFKAIQLGEGGEIFIPKLPSFKITQLIKSLDKIYDTVSEIEDVGIRPGEKIHELMINESEISYTHEFEDYFIIMSQIQKYTEIELPYLKEGKKLSVKDIQEYSSKDNCVSDEEVEEIVRNQLFKKV